MSRPDDLYVGIPTEVSTGCRKWKIPFAGVVFAVKTFPVNPKRFGLPMLRRCTNLIWGFNPGAGQNESDR